MTVEMETAPVMREWKYLACTCGHYHGFDGQRSYNPCPECGDTAEERTMRVALGSIGPSMLRLYPPRVDGT